MPGDVDNRFGADTLVGESKGWGKVDFLAAGVFFFLALICSLFWWQGFIPFPFLGGDAGIHASYAAAFRYPQLFANDPILNTVENFSFYRIFHLDLLLYILYNLYLYYFTY